MSMPALWAASYRVVPGGTATCLPSMVTVIVDVTVASGIKVHPHNRANMHEVDVCESRSTLRRSFAHGPPKIHPGEFGQDQSRTKPGQDLASWRSPCARKYRAAPGCSGP